MWHRVGVLTEEMKRITEGIPKFNPDRFLDFDLEDIYMYCAVNGIQNPYISNYIKTRKQIEDEENTNEREDTSQYPPIISYDESGNEEEPSIQPISLIRSSKRGLNPHMMGRRKIKDEETKVKRYPSQMMLLLLLLVMMIIAILLVLSIFLMMRVIMLMI